MRIELTKQECLWLASLVELEKEAIGETHAKTPHPTFALRRDNMAALERKLMAAIERQPQRGNNNRCRGAR